MRKVLMIVASTIIFSIGVVAGLLFPGAKTEVEEYFTKEVRDTVYIDTTSVKEKESIFEIVKELKTNKIDTTNVSKN